MKNTIAYFVLLGVIRLVSAQSIADQIANAEKNLEKNHWEKAVKNYENILAKEVDNLTYLQRANIYNDLGYLNLQLLDPIEAERYLNLSILYHEESGFPNEKDYADALLNMGILYMDQVEFDLSRNYIQKSLGILENLPNYRADYWIARSKLALLYEEVGSHTLALSIYNESYDQLVASGNDLSPDFAEICMHKGRILMLTGDPHEGEKFINLSSTIYESLGSDYAVQRAESLESLAVFYERMGRFGEAEQTLLEVLRLKRSIPDEADILIIETLNDLGILYHQIGQYDQAKEMFNEVVQECEENVGTDHPFYATAKNNLGTLALAEGNVELARSMFNDALATYEARFGNNHPYYANALNNLARVERKLGNLESAERYYMEVLRIDEKIYGKQHPDYATTLVNVGVLYSSTGKEEEAAKYYEEAVKIREEVLGVNHPSYGSALEYMGMHYMAVDNKTRAEEYFRKAVQIQIGQINILFPIMTEQERQIFYQNIRSNVDRYNCIATELLHEKPELLKNIFEFQTNTKSILFNNSKKVLSEVMESDDFELKQKFNNWISDKRLLASYYQMGHHELEDLNINLSFEEARVEQLESDLERRLTLFSGSIQNTKYDWKSIRNAIESDEALVEIVQIKEYKSLSKDQGALFGFTGQTKYLAIIIYPDEAVPNYMLISDSYLTESEHFSSYSQAVTSNSGYQDAFNSLWSPIHKELKTINTLKVIPDGIYNKINLNILKPDLNKNVIDNYYVSYLTSARDLFKDQLQVFNKKSYLFGKPYFSTENEHLIEEEGLHSNVVKGVEQIFLPSDWNVKSFIERDANELRLRSAYNPTILHISSSCFFRDKYNFISTKSPINNPLFQAGVLLSGAGQTFSRFTDGIATISENDGVLTTYEAMNLDLSRTQLVFLSACDIKVTNLENIHGVFGLQSAFMLAGARNLITSVSKVDEEAINELMALFYKKLIETNAVDESLKYAQIKLREKYSDPRIWGAFVHIGNG